MKNEKTISSGNVLMDLRIVILRTIASVWEDDKKTEHDTVRCRLLNLGFPNYQIDEQLSESKHLHDKLDQQLSLREILTNIEPNLLKQYFMCVYKYSIPFANFGVEFIPGSAKWENNKWTKPDSETISLVLPSCEDSWNSYQRANHLMDFYHFFPNFFGSKRSEDFGEDEHQPDHETVNAPNPVTTAGAVISKLIVTAKDTAMKNSRIDFSGNDYHLGVAEDNFLGFGALTNKIIADTWDDKTFKDFIDYDEFKKSNKPDNIYYSRIAFILKEYYEFEIPWAFNIKFRFSRKVSEEPQSLADSQAPFWNRSDEHWGWNNHNIIRNTVSLEIPITPDSDKDNVSLALARYNLIGPAYPFTCS